MVTRLAHFSSSKGQQRRRYFNVTAKRFKGGQVPPKAAAAARLVVAVMLAGTSHVQKAVKRHDCTSFSSRTFYVRGWVTTTKVVTRFWCGHPFLGLTTNC